MTGVVTSDKTSKTRRVEVTRLVRHARYSKIQRRRTICIAHDEENVSHAGDLVDVEESRPMSKTKRWIVLRVVGQGVAAEEAAKRALAHAEGGHPDEVTTDDTPATATMPQAAQ
jgi:small subunit ribosomal protein S17